MFRLWNEFLYPFNQHTLSRCNTSWNEKIKIIFMKSSTIIILECITQSPVSALLFLHQFKKFEIFSDRNVDSAPCITNIETQFHVTSHTYEAMECYVVWNVWHVYCPFKFRKLLHRISFLHSIDIILSTRLILFGKIYQMFGKESRLDLLVNNVGAGLCHHHHLVVDPY